MRDAKGKTHISLIPLVLLLQRQSRAAFESLATMQSYQAWVLARPGVEAALILGKWVDDPLNATIWKNRVQDWRKYQQTYSGKGLRSQSLIGSDRIQAVLSKINDDFIHANPEYYGRHLEAAPGEPGYVNFWMGYFDPDPLHQANAFAFFHLLLFIQENLRALFSRLFAKQLVLQSSLSSFATTFGPRVAALAAQSEDAKRILVDLGAIDLGSLTN